MNHAPLSWIKEIQHTLIDAKAIPLFGNAPDFPWEKLSHKVADLLHASEMKVSLYKTSFVKQDDILSGLGAYPVSIVLQATPLSGAVYWVMGKEDVSALTAMALTENHETKGFSSSKFQEGFYYYLATQIVQLIDEMNAFGDLSIKIAKPALPSQEDALCMDIEIQIHKHKCWGRLVCPASFHEAFRSHFYSQTPSLLTRNSAKKMDVTVGIELGHTELSVSEWKKVGIGDFILLDRCTFDPTTKKGTAALTLEGTPLMRVRIKDNSLKIIDYAFYREEQNPMNPEIPPDEEGHNAHMESEDFSSAEFDDENSDHQGEHLWSPENGGAEKLISSKEIPLTLTVEVARMRINLEKLTQLSPGNVLELPVRPEHGVDIVIGGKKVAKAELVKLGEMLGIKILQLGD